MSWFDSGDHFAEEHPQLLLPADIIENPPSSKLYNIPKETERKYRTWGCELIQECAVLLQLPQVVCATALTLFHRFYYRRAIQEFDVHITAMSCVFLAAKVEESPRRIRDVVNVMYHVKLARQYKPSKPLTLGGELYAKWKAAVLRTERFILKELGFSMYNITEHPHKFILYYIAVLEGSQNLAQMAWDILNDCLRLDLCVRFRPQSIACAAIYLASRKLREPLPMHPPWFEVFNTSKHELFSIGEEILELYLQPSVHWLEPLRRCEPKEDDDVGEGRAVPESDRLPNPWAHHVQQDDTDASGPTTDAKETAGESSAPYSGAATTGHDSAEGRNAHRADSYQQSTSAPHASNALRASHRRSRSPARRDSYGRSDRRDERGRSRSVSPRSRTDRFRSRSRSPRHRIRSPDRGMRAGNSRTRSPRPRSRSRTRTPPRHRYSRSRSRSRSWRRHRSRSRSGGDSRRHRGTHSRRSRSSSRRRTYR